MNYKKLHNAVMECYRRMYKVSTPPTDIDVIVASCEGQQPMFFNKYYLPLARQMLIIEEVCKQMKLSKREAHTVSCNVCLGAAPNSSLKSWLEAREILK